MGIRRSYILVLLLFLVTCTLHAQPNRYGVPLITNYPHSITGGGEQNWCITQDLRGVVYVGNNDKGVLEFDGVEWRTIPVPNSPFIRSIITGEDGVVYVGAVSEFGYLAPDNLGSMQYNSLSDTVDRDQYPFSGVWKTYFINEKVYFCTYARIFIYDPQADTLSIIPTPQYSFFSYFVDNTLYLSDYGEGLMQFRDDQFVSVTGGRYFREKSVTGVARFDGDQLLIGTSNYGLSLFNTKNGSVDQSFIEPGLNQYLMEGVITNLHPLEEGFAVTTIYNGIVIVDRNGEAKQIITENEGLIDEAIPSIFSNHSRMGSGPIWIANWLGVSKLEKESPFRVFTEISGFSGFVMDIKQFQGTLFIATSEGVFYKKSTSTGTSFIAINEIQDDIRHLHILEPGKGVELLLAFSEGNLYVIDQHMQVSILGELVINPHEDPKLRDMYSGKFLVQDPKTPDVVYTGRSQIVGLQYISGRWKEVMRIEDLPEEDHSSLVIDRFGYLWTCTPSHIIRIDISQKKEPSLKFFIQENGLPSNDKNRVFTNPDNGDIIIGTVDGFYRYNYFRDTIYRDTILNKVLPSGKNHIHAFHKDKEGDYWYSFENEFSGWTELVARMSGGNLEVIREKSFQRLPDVSTEVFYDDPEQGVWFGKSNELYHFNKDFARIDTLPFQTLIRSVTIDNDSLLFYGTNFRKDEERGNMIHFSQDEGSRPQISYRYNNIEFRWSAPYFEQEDKLEYSYKLVGFDETWSDWSTAAYKDFTNLHFRDYTIHVKAKNIYGDESLPARYSFTILRPWYATYLAIIAYILLTGLAVFIIIKLYTRRLKQENIRLEGIIEERTAEIRKQKEELTDSIEYASRIQRALLPPVKLMDEHNIEHFILFRPRDIVSGDFYWIGSKNGKLLIVAADCTGHGVPGAFMSMLGMTFLDEIVIKSEITLTNEILEQLREHVITSLRQSGKDQDSTKDGMDLAMISIDTQTHEIQFSGAYNPLYMVRTLRPGEKTKLTKGEELDLPRGSIHDDKHILLQIRADQMPIGISEKTSPFSRTNMADEGYSIYMFSDGYLDQFGGPRGKKFMSKNFKKLILEMQSIPLKDQGTALEKVLMEWMGEISQIDDILVMGLRMNDQ